MRSQQVTIRHRIVLCGLLVVFGVLPRGAAATELKLVGTVHTHNLRGAMSRALREENQSLAVRLGILSERQEQREPWWQDPRAAVIHERPMRGVLRMAIERDLGHPPLGLPIAITAVAVVVNARNPIVGTGIEVADLRRAFSATRDPRAAISFWGQLGLEGEWKRRRVSLVLREDAQSTNLFRDLVLDGAALHPRIDRILGASRDLVETIVRNERAMGVLELHAVTASIAVVPVADGAEAVVPTLENVRTGEYPIASCVRLYLSTAPGAPLRPAKEALLRFIWSEAGQDILANHGYVSLPRASVLRAREWVAARRGDPGSVDRLAPLPCRSPARPVP